MSGPDARIASTTPSVWPDHTLTDQGGRRQVRDRALNLLAKLNDPPLIAKLRGAADRDGVPLTDAEIALLQRVRVVRNDTAHGRDAKLPTVDDLDYAVSMVTRLLLHSIARR